MEKVLNEVKRVFIHARWRLHSFTLLAFLFGMLVGHIRFSEQLLFGFIAWLLLGIGATVYNSYYDKDTEPVAGLEKPPAVHISMLIGAWFFKLLGLIIAFFLNPLFLSIYILSLFSSVLYSYKKTRFKSNGYVALIFNFIMGGVVYLSVSSFSNQNIMLVVLGSVTCASYIAAMYLMMQIHQKKEDSMRHDTSIMILHGRKKTLIAAIILFIIAAIAGDAACIVSSLNPLYALLMTIYFLIAIFFILRWLKHEEDPQSDFQIMNRLTLRLSYAGIFLLIIAYIFSVALR